MIIDPHYPKVILTFTYQGHRIEIERDTDEFDGETYAAWVNHAKGCAIAVPLAMTRMDAVRKAKQWVDKKLGAID
jgi:hypothetical protein